VDARIGFVVVVVAVVVVVVGVTVASGCAKKCVCVWVGGGLVEVCDSRIV